MYVTPLDHVEVAHYPGEDKLKEHLTFHMKPLHGTFEDLSEIFLVRIKNFKGHIMIHLKQDGVARTLLVAYGVNC